MLSRAYNAVKSVTSNAWTGVKKYFWPASFTAGKVMGSAGGVLNSAKDLADKGYRAYTHSPDPKAPAPQSVRVAVQLVPVIANVIVQSATRGSAIFKFFSEADSDAKYTYQMPGEVENPTDDDHNVEAPGWFANWIHPDLDAKWNTVFIFLRGSLNVSQFFMYLNTTYNSIKLLALFAQLVSGTSDASTAGLIVELLLALFSAAAGAIAALSLNIPASTANYLEILKKIKNGEAKLTPILALTLVLVLLNISSTIFASYYSTSYAFEWYKAQISILNLVLTTSVTKTLVLASTSVGAIGELGRGSSVNRLISKWKTTLSNCGSVQPTEQSPLLLMDRSELLPGYWSKLRIMLIAAGAVDASYAGLQNIITVPYVAKQLAGIDPDNTALNTFAVSTGVAAGLITFAFTWEAINQAEERMIVDRIKAARNARLEEIIMQDDDSDNETTPLFKSASYKTGPKFFDVAASFDDAEPLIKQDKYFDMVELSDDEAAKMIADSSSSSSDSDSGSAYKQRIKTSGSKYKY